MLYLLHVNQHLIPNPKQSRIAALYNASGLRSSWRMKFLKDADALTPAFKSRIEVNLIREGVGLAGGYWGYMVLVFIDDGHNLHGCSLKRRSHGLDDFCALCDILSIGGAGATMWTA